MSVLCRRGPPRPAAYINRCTRQWFVVLPNSSTIRSTLTVKTLHVSSQNSPLVVKYYCLDDEEAKRLEKRDELILEYINQVPKAFLGAGDRFLDHTRQRCTCSAIKDFWEKHKPKDEKADSNS